MYTIYGHNTKQKYADLLRFECCRYRDKKFSGKNSKQKKREIFVSKRHFTGRRLENSNANGKTKR